MRKILLIIAFASLAFSPSCEKSDNLDSLEGTYWKARTNFPAYDEYEEFWIEDELIFSSSVATLITTRKDGSISYGSAPYIYDPPKVKVIVKNEAPPPSDPNEWYVPEMTFEGTVENEIMTFGIHETFDVIRPVELKRQ